MAEVIDSAFARNLQPILPDRARRLRVLSAGTDLRAVVGAYAHDELVGVIGLKTAAVGAFSRMSFGMLRAELGAGVLKARIALKVLDRPLQAGTMRIEFLAVDRSARGRGVGSALLRAVEQRACDERARLLEVHVEATNSDAHRFYERSGYRDAPAQRDSVSRRWFQNQTDIRMTKEPLCTIS